MGLRLSSLMILLALNFNVKAILTSNSTVACPDEAVQFTCTLPGSFIRWDVSKIIVDGTVITDTITLHMEMTMDSSDTPNFVFQGVLTDTSGENLTATLTTVTKVSMLNGTMLRCVGDSLQEGPEVLLVADSPSQPLITTVEPASQDGTNSSNITIEWNSPSDTGGVSVRYVLSILPPPLSGSPVTVETTSAVIAVEYNRAYNVTISAENCAGMSDEVMLPVNQIVACPSNPSTATGVVINSLPPVTTVGSKLMFMCTESSVMETSTCDSQGMWSPDLETYVCPTAAPPVMCAAPSPPVNGSILNDTTGPSPVNTVVYYRCDDGLFPAGNLSSTCDSDGVWNPINPQEQLCSPEPFTCTVPEAPTNGFVVQTSNTTIVFGCNKGFSPQQNRTTNCTETNQWSSLPEGLLCMIVTVTKGTPLSTGGAVGVTLAVSAVVFTILGFLAGVAVTYLFTRKKAVYSPTEGQANIQPTVPAGPVYEDLLPAPKEEIELKTNDAYGQARR